MKLDPSYFDAVIDRAGTACEKWDGRAEVFGRANVIPLWVADMDFACAPEIVEALKARAAHPIYGYTQDDPENRMAEVRFLRRRFGLTVEPDWILQSPSVVDSMLFSLYALTREGERVLIQPPVYGPFRETVLRAGREVAESPLLETDEGWKMDFDGLEAAFQSGVKCMFFCSPHNPVGRVWTRAELERLVALAEKYQVMIVADEIHASFAFAPHVHTPLLTLTSRAVMLTSATKAFNLAGLRQSSVIVPDGEVRARLAKEMHRVNADHPNLFAMAAQRAAYEHGDAWLDGCIDYICENRNLVYDFIGTRLPEISLKPLEGTYLVWLDMRATGVEHEAMFRRLIDVGGVGLNSGLFFGEKGRGFFRLNLATQRKNIQAGLEGIERALRM
ncbi:MAG TPA: PatB family C-S lyase [Candidatus Pullichristensenella stercorigallinarum]|uniref:cysteine-S-conjugate beta-lyase n=1 Tax=Candidatus Pullichristensenella stercorigallinarum TaxID=2840909 RepID=A0A9D0ZQR0_9FIRM|nr:PatB family C-S lyase [Candidatus Pullichristensenella stercorigallinarum]